MGPLVENMWTGTNRPWPRARTPSHWSFVADCTCWSAILGALGQTVTRFPGDGREQLVNIIVHGLAVWLIGTRLATRPPFFVWILGHWLRVPCFEGVSYVYYRHPRPWRVWTGASEKSPGSAWHILGSAWQILGTEPKQKIGSKSTPPRA